MSLVPIIKCSDVEYSLKFYTKLLDFQELECESDFSFAVIARGDYSVALSSHQGDGEFGFCMMTKFTDNCSNAAWMFHCSAAFIGNRLTKLGDCASFM
jgi:hypothetical protein